MISAGHSSIHDLKSSKVDMDYCKIPEAEFWKVDTLKELIEVKYDQLELPGFEKQEINDIMEYICTG